jgi:hypothetical protein
MHISMSLTLAETGETLDGIGILRLRDCFAARSNPSAQDDRAQDDRAQDDSAVYMPTAIIPP